MKKNYYEILEVDKNASQEIIKKAYSTLAKRYHPDLQPPEQKTMAEEKFKLINEAYETLSDNELKKQYDANLSNQLVSRELYDSLCAENLQLKQLLNNVKTNNINYNMSSNNNYASRYGSSINNNYNNNYTTDYNNDYNNTYYNEDNNIIKRIKEVFKKILSILITVLVIYIIFNSSIIKNFINFIFSIF